MEDNQIKYKRRNGLFYTPKDLALYLVRPLINSSIRTIFDPAYGEGALLLAAETIYTISNRKNKLNLFGCDIHPVNGLLKHIPEANLMEQDFFELQNNYKYDVIITNPPYVRHQVQEKKVIAKYRTSNEELCFLSNSSDLWAYFVVKCVSHLNANGSIGAILPWSFLQADYAKPLRQWLYERFKTIKVLALNNEYFSDANERIILLWLVDYGKEMESLKIAFANDFRNEVAYSEIRKDEWTSNRVFPNINLDLGSILKYLEEEGIGFSTFENHAYARIGIVTGANSFFIKENGSAIEAGFRESNLVPIITSSKEFPEILLNGIGILKRLITIDDKQGTQHEDFISKGLDSNIHTRSHCKARRAWYSIDPGKLPDAFFPYRVSKIPYLLLNDDGIQSTNSVHRIFFKNCSEIEKKWIFVSMLSIYSQLSIIANAKSYGRGMVKIEPGSLKNVLVVKHDDPIVLNVYYSIIEKLRRRSKFEAVMEATSFLESVLDMNSEIKELANAAWNQLQSIK